MAEWARVLLDFVVDAGDFGTGIAPPEARGWARVPDKGASHGSLRGNGGTRMQVREIMTREPGCCTPDTKIQDVARMMVEHDCGEIPVVESSASKRPIGVVTDRDITVRVVAEGRDPGRTTARECMSTPVFTVTPDTEIESACQILEQHQVRRVPVVDERGTICGMVSQADIATFASERDTAEVVRSISQPAGTTQRTRYY